MPLTTAQLLTIKRRLVRSFSAKARQWQDPTYLPFVSSARRRANVFSLNMRVKQLKSEIAQLDRYNRRGSSSD